MGFNIYPFKLVCEFLTPACFPKYKGFSLRGAFGSAFRKVSCPVGFSVVCNNCLLRSNCAYFNVFDPVKQENDYGKDVIRPFVLEPPYDEKRIYREKEEICFNLIVFGEYVKYFPFFIMAFMEMGRKKIGIPEKRGSFILKKVLDREGNSLLANDKTSFKRPLVYRFNKIRKIGKVLKIVLVSPLRTKRYGHYVNPHNFSWELFVEIVRRRLYLINQLYSVFEDSILREVDSLSECIVLKRRLFWKELERYSARQHTRMKMGGVSGYIEVALPKGLRKKRSAARMLEIAEILHLGKNTTFGLGKIVVKEVSDE